MQLMYAKDVRETGVDTLKNEGRCSNFGFREYTDGGVDTLKNEGRCSHSPVQGVDTLENEGIYIVRVRG